VLAELSSAGGGGSCADADATRRRIIGMRHWRFIEVGSIRFVLLAS